MVRYIGGLRAGMGHCGARNTDMIRWAKFVRITGAGVRETSALISPLRRSRRTIRGGGAKEGEDGVEEESANLKFQPSAICDGVAYHVDG